MWWPLNLESVWEYWSPEEYWYSEQLQCCHKCKESKHDTGKIWDDENVVLFWLLGPAVNNPDETWDWSGEWLPWLGLIAGEISEDLWNVGYKDKNSDKSSDWSDDGVDFLFVHDLFSVYGLRLVFYQNLERTVNSYCLFAAKGLNLKAYLSEFLKI